MTPKQTYQKIEKKFNWLRSEIWRKMEIWEYIVMQINSTEGEQKEFWWQVLDEYKKVNTTNKNNGKQQSTGDGQHSGMD